MTSPTATFYAGLQAAFDHFNDHLFEGRLPPCLITLRSASRVYGYHHAHRFVSPNGEELDELGLHPGFFTLRPVEAVLSTLVHEMVHHWQQHSGSPSPSNPHNREWGSKMESLGLMPSSTGLPGGKRTGRTVSHYILPDGHFIGICRTLVDQGFKLLWLDRHAPINPVTLEAQQTALREAGLDIPLTPPPITTLPQQIDGKPTLFSPPPKRAPSKQKLTCPKCNTRAWVAPKTRIICAQCEVEMLGSDV